MKTSLILILLTAFYYVNGQAFNSPDQDSDKILIRTITSMKINGKETRTDTLTVINSAYFEVGLYSMGDLTKYRAEKTLAQTRTADGYRFSSFTICKEDGDDIFFKTTKEFLNYMDAKGYQMVDQTKYQYHTDYTFKRK